MTLLLPHQNQLGLFLLGYLHIRVTQRIQLQLMLVSLDRKYLCQNSNFSTQLIIKYSP